MDRARIPRAASARLSLYHRQLEACLARGEETVSSMGLASALGLTAAQVRKDLAHFGQFGHAGVGYRVEQLLKEIRKILGTDRVWNVVLVGAGNLGNALVRYRGFEARGFRIVRILDVDPALTDSEIEGIPVRPLEELEATISSEAVNLAIVAVPATEAQDVVDRLTAAGVTGILNFAPVPLDTPPHVAVSNVDLAMELEQLTYLVLSREE